MVDCQFCKHYDWQQAAKFYAIRTCSIDKSNINGDCKFYESTTNKNGCTFIGIYGVSPEGVCCGECDENNPSCERMRKK